MKQRFIESELPVAKVNQQKNPQDDSSDGGDDENDEEEEENEQQGQSGVFADNSYPEEPLDPTSIEAVKSAFESRLSSRRSVSSYFPNLCPRFLNQPQKIRRSIWGALPTSSAS